MFWTPLLASLWQPNPASVGVIFWSLEGHMSQTPLLDHDQAPGRSPEARARPAAPARRRTARRDDQRRLSQTGGHLGAGLGVVELTVALHYVFDTPRDVLIWDVGHQAYPHKILTGRRDRIRTLRQGGGLSGFTKRAESEYDPFGAAHAATSICAALGFAVARDQRGDGQPRHRRDRRRLDVGGHGL